MALMLVTVLKVGGKTKGEMIHLLMVFRRNSYRDGDECWYH